MERRICFWKRSWPWAQQAVTGGKEPVPLVTTSALSQPLSQDLGLSVTLSAGVLVGDPTRQLRRSRVFPHCSSPPSHKRAQRKSGIESQHLAVPALSGPRTGLGFVATCGCRGRSMVWGGRGWSRGDRVPADTRFPCCQVPVMVLPLHSLPG